MRLTSKSLQCLERLRSYKPPSDTYPNTPRLRAAVLLLLFGGKEGELRVLLTVRARNMRTFSGDAALPGGRVDEGETIWQAALREAHEEIALLPDSAMEKLTLLPPYLSRNHLVVTPCVAFWPADNGRPNFRLNEAEVSKIFSVPFEDFLSGREGWYDPLSHTTWNGENFPLHQFGGGGEGRVWGLTARMMIDAARIAYGAEPDFPVGLVRAKGGIGDQEEFIWRGLEWAKKNKPSRKGQL
ncbi:hypothetical protein G7K_5534-t1 [Saitoella complicata NRRL Y-17804]|uniref:Nudix hydrolase domain-containing protein n=2 Tax=Saitoella complicata (strain BCRC 22490 / CBS 7301 / JCM 7358 / NBRC 10748 / NRRL Y-17804) TaxID=698492 RepID=A0A0E9NNR0_SAICN|nr:hypothetical protein G7K_5534-t1 [Saitoella complicata NRRL Y-17804]